MKRGLFFLFIVEFFLVSAVLAQSNSCNYRSTAKSCNSQSRSVERLNRSIDTVTANLARTKSQYDLQLSNAAARYSESIDRAVFRSVSTVQNCEAQYRRSYSNLNCYFGFNCGYRKSRIEDRRRVCLRRADVNESYSKRQAKQRYTSLVKSAKLRFDSRIGSLSSRLQREQTRLSNASRDLQRCLSCLNS